MPSGDAIHWVTPQHNRAAGLAALPRQQHPDSLSSALEECLA
jgi:hypothetical protein